MTSPTPSHAACRLVQPLFAVLLKRLCRPAGLMVVLLSAAFPVLANAQTVRGLKDAYRGSFDIGVGLSVANVDRQGQHELVTANFSTATAENAMKPASVHPREGVYTWEGADRIADFCRRHGMKMRGHCLCWHNQFADWMFTESLGREVSKMSAV